MVARPRLAPVAGTIQAGAIVCILTRSMNIAAATEPRWTVCMKVWPLCSWFDCW